MGADTSVSAHRVPRSGTSWWENAVGLIDRAMFAAPKGPPVPGEVPETGVVYLPRNNSIVDHSALKARRERPVLTVTPDAGRLPTGGQK